jgi:PHD/YefM family antitoxin component YafN of YafNO toxin-antitoxin module
MSAVPFSSFQSLDVTRFRQTLARLHEAVGCGHGRIEVTRRGCDDVCVLISKCELEALEQALDILAQSAEYKAMCDSLQSVVAQCGGCAEGEPTLSKQDGATSA